jgi:RNA polymerase sigma factor (sigma-70 family)
MTPMAPEILGQLYRQHAPALRLYARQWPGQAEDLVHEAFVKLAQETPPPENIVPWLYRVVRNAALQAGRAATRRRRRERLVSATEVWFARTDDQVDAREASQLLAELPLELREVVVARLWGGLTFEEIAELSGCSLPTAHRRYRAALNTLRERLEGPCTQMARNRTI